MIIMQPFLIPLDLNIFQKKKKKKKLIKNKNIVKNIYRI